MGDTGHAVPGRDEAHVSPGHKPARDGAAGQEIASERVGEGLRLAWRNGEGRLLLGWRGGVEAERGHAGVGRQSAPVQIWRWELARREDMEGCAVEECGVKGEGAVERELRSANVRLPEGMEPAD